MAEYRIMATGLGFPEGPVAMPDGSVILTEIRSRRVSRVTPDGSSDDTLGIPAAARTVWRWVPMVRCMAATMVAVATWRDHRWARARWKAIPMAGSNASMRRPAKRDTSTPR